ncbi:MAG: uracil phosphoribosyltransferase [Actinobacteria bacterium]|nr:uracil phosphoribosyltransferase [Actinomycetota bacterium]
MPVTVVEHPLVGHLLTELRDRDTPPHVFRTLTKRLTFALLLEAVRDLSPVPRAVDTPLEQTDGFAMPDDLVAVPILRAGLGMLEAVVDLLPEVSVGYIGLERDHATFEPSAYYEKLPPMEGHTVLLLDPMLATGGSASRAISVIKARRPREVRLVCVVAAPEGAERLAADHPDVRVFAASLDRELNDRAYILPGLGDFGDRLYGTEP